MKRYRPSNGTEGECFHEKWCMNCAKDAHMNSGKPWDDCEEHEICSIIGDTLAYPIDSPDYPKEWVYGKDGPMCTAFIPMESEKPMERCKHTIDMFGEAA